jgi:hypothetical protein
VRNQALERLLHARALQVSGEFRAGDITRFVWVLARGGLCGGLSESERKAGTVVEEGARQGQQEAEDEAANNTLLLLIEHLDSRALAVLGDFNPKDISLLVWSAARAEWRPSDALLDALAGRAQGLAGQFIAKDISNLIWGLARLRRPASPPLLAALIGQLRALQSRKGLDPQEMVDLLWASAEGGIMNPAVLDCVTTEALRKCTRFKGTNIASFLGALASCDCVASPVLLSAMLGQANAVARTLRPRDMSGILYALARSGNLAGNLGQAASTALSLRPMLDVALEEHHNFDPRGLSNVLWALAAACVPSHASLWRALCLQAEKVGDCFYPMDIANLLDALTKARKAPQAGLLKVLVARTVTTAKPANDHAWSPKNVSSVLLSVASLGLSLVAVQDMVRSLLDLTHRHRGAFTGREVSVLMWALAVFDPTPDGAEPGARPLGLALLEFWCSFAIPFSFSPTQRLQLHQYFLSLAAPPPPSLANLARECEADWRRYHVETRRIPGALPCVVATRLGELGIGFTEEAVLPDSGYSVDLLLTGCERVVIEVNGPTHYIRHVLGAGEDAPASVDEKDDVCGDSNDGDNSLQQLNGASLLKLRLLRARGWTVVVIPFFTFQNLRTAGEERKYLSTLLAQHGVTLPAEPLLDCTAPPLEHV